MQDSGIKKRGAFVPCLFSRVALAGLHTPRLLSSPDSYFYIVFYLLVVSFVFLSFATFSIPFHLYNHLQFSARRYVLTSDASYSVHCPRGIAHQRLYAMTFLIADASHPFVQQPGRSNPLSLLESPSHSFADISLCLLLARTLTATL